MHVVRQMSVVTIFLSMVCGFAAPLAFAQEQAKAGDAGKVAEAISKLDAHVSGQAKLEDKQIQALTKQLNDNAAAVTSSAKLVEACFDLVKNYESKHGILFVDNKGMSTKKPKAANAIHWAAFWVMQNLIDQVYTNQGMKQFGKVIDGRKFLTADYFPGKVQQPATDGPYTVKISGSYSVPPGSPVFHQDRPARKPTGAYLIPGTIATVTVPQSIVGKGYQVRVGAHSWDLTKKPRVNRLFRVSTVYDIDSTQTQVANPLGGGIYIEVPLGAEAGVIDVTITGAARSPYFSHKPFHETSLTQWRETERNFKSPWTDIQSEKYMVQVPTSWIYKLDDPLSMVKDWDKAIDVTNWLMGKPGDYTKETIYSQVDTQLRGRAFHPGYPGGNRGHDPMKDYGGNHNHHLVQGPKTAHSYELHELGHGFLFPKYAGDREAAVNLLHVAVMNKAFDMPLDQAFRSSRSMDGNTFRTLDTTAIAWMMIDSFVGDGMMKGYERQYQLKGHAKFVDIARLFGWDAIHKFFRSTEQDYIDGNPWPRNNAGEDGDRYTLRLCESAGADLRPLIHFWGIPPHEDAALETAIKNAGLKPSMKVYDQLVKYKSLVPEDREAFRAFALKWWDKQPSPKGYTTERNHAARWESYDAKYAQKVRDTVQAIIDRYFPDGRPE